MQNQIKELLHQLAEEDYRRFASGLLPGTDHVLGVRLPLLRKMARSLAKSDWQVYLQTATEETFEEIMLHGMVIGYVKCPLEERLSLIHDFLPKINNWSVCDSFCSGLKFTRDYPGEVWEFLQPCFRSDREFHIRFAVVMLIFYYIDDSHLDAVLMILDAVRHEGYYVKMAVAWAVSICYVKYPEATMIYLTHHSLDDVTFRKALQKITESRAVDAQSKKRIRALAKLD